MSNAEKLQNVCYAKESAFGETGSTVSTLRLPAVGKVDTSGLKHDKIDPDRLKQYLQGDPGQWILGTQGGTFKTKLWLCGHGSATSGSTTIGLVEQLLGDALGGVTLTGASGTTSSGGTVSALTTAASATLAAGGLTPIGAANDGRGNGQMVAISSHVTTTLNLLTAIDAQTSGTDVVGSAVNIYPYESTYTVNSFRFLIGSANLQYLCHGCVATDFSFGGLNTGEVPYVEITWQVSWWEYSTATFPSAVTTETFTPTPCAAGSFFVNDVGTATRSKRTMRGFTLDYKHGVELLPGPGGNSAYQMYIGARRTPSTITVSWVEDADAATTTPVLPGYGTGTTSKHALYTLNSVAGKRVALYFPNLCINNVAIQYADSNINRLKVSAQAYVGSDTTSELSKSAMRLGLA